MPEKHTKVNTARRRAAPANAEMPPAQRIPATSPAPKRKRPLGARPAPTDTTPMPPAAEVQDQISAGPDAPEIDEATLMRMVEDMRRAKGTHKRKLNVREMTDVASSALLELRYVFVIGLAGYLYAYPEVYFSMVAFVTDIAGLDVTQAKEIATLQHR